MKRWVAGILIVSVLFCLTGCYNKNGSTTTTPDAATTTVTTSTTVTTAKPKKTTAKPNTTQSVKQTTTKVAITTITEPNVTAVAKELFFLDADITASANPVPGSAAEFSSQQLLFPFDNETAWMCTMPYSWKQTLKQTNYLTLTKNGKPVGRILHKLATSLATGASVLQEYVYANQQNVKIVEYTAQGGRAQVYRATIKIARTNETAVLEIDCNYLSADAFGAMALSFFAISTAAPTTQTTKNRVPEQIDALDKVGPHFLYIFGDKSLDSAVVSGALQGMLSGNGWSSWATFIFTKKDANEISDWISDKDFKEKIKEDGYSERVVVMWTDSLSSNFEEVVIENGGVPVLLLDRYDNPLDNPDTIKVQWYRLKQYLKTNHSQWMYMKNTKEAKLSPYAGYAMALLLFNSVCGELPSQGSGVGAARTYLMNCGMEKDAAEEKVKSLYNSIRSFVT